MLALFWDDDEGAADLGYADGRLAEGRDLETAVLLSLFLDAEASAQERAAGWARGGCWADSVVPEQAIGGSRLWLLDEQVLGGDVQAEVESRAAEALQWMIEEGAAASVQARATRHAEGVSLVVTIQRPDDPSAQLVGPWEVARAL